MHLFNGAWVSKEQKKYAELYKFYYNKYKKWHLGFLTKILTKLVVNYQINSFKVFLKKVLYKMFFRK